MHNKSNQVELLKVPFSENGCPISITGKNVVTAFIGQDLPRYHVLKGFIRGMKNNPNTTFTFLGSQYSEGGQVIDHAEYLKKVFGIKIQDGKAIDCDNLESKNNNALNTHLYLKADRDFIKAQINSRKLIIKSAEDELNSIIQSTAEEQNSLINKCVQDAVNEIHRRIENKDKVAYAYDIFKFLIAAKPEYQDYLFADLSCEFNKDIIKKIKEINNQYSSDKNGKCNIKPCTYKSCKGESSYISLIGQQKNGLGNIQEDVGCMSLGYFINYDLKEFKKRWPYYTQGEIGGNLASGDSGMVVYPGLNFDLLYASNNLGSWQKDAPFQENKIINKRHEAKQGYVESVSSGKSTNTKIHNLKEKLDKLIKEEKLAHIMKCFAFKKLQPIPNDTNKTVITQNMNVNINFTKIENKNGVDQNKYSIKVSKNDMETSFCGLQQRFTIPIGTYDVVNNAKQAPRFVPTENCEKAKNNMSKIVNSVIQETVDRVNEKLLARGQGQIDIENVKSFLQTMQKLNNQCGIFGEAGKDENRGANVGFSAWAKDKDGNLSVASAFGQFLCAASSPNDKLQELEIYKLISSTIQSVSKQYGLGTEDGRSYESGNEEGMRSYRFAKLASVVGALEEKRRY